MVNVQRLSTLVWRNEVRSRPSRKMWETSSLSKIYQQNQFKKFASDCSEKISLMGYFCVKQTTFTHLWFI